MTRAIKFRAWDEISNQMVHNVAVYDDGDHIGFSDHGNPHIDSMQSNLASDDGWMYFLDSFVLMQYTGLRDRADNPIYEGDIISVAEALYTVAWRVETASFVKVGRRDSYTSLKHSYQFADVVGNVYETPELLETADT